MIGPKYDNGNNGVSTDHYVKRNEEFYLFRLASCSASPLAQSRAQPGGAFHVTQPQPSLTDKLHSGLRDSGVLLFSLSRRNREALGGGGNLAGVLRNSKTSKHALV